MKQVIQDTNGNLSSKRVAVLIAMIVLIVLILIDTFTGFTVRDNIFNTLEWIIIAGLGVVGSERFSKRYLQKDKK